MGQQCDVALRYLELESTGAAARANAMLALPAELHQFRDRPAFTPATRPESLSEEEVRVVRALGALVRFTLVACRQEGAAVSISIPDFTKIFPGRTGGIGIVVPAAKDRDAAMNILRQRFGDLRSIPMVEEIVMVPIVTTSGGPKVGI
jgi:hypothetical protein